MASKTSKAPASDRQISNTLYSVTYQTYKDTQDAEATISAVKFSIEQQRVPRQLAGQALQQLIQSNLQHDYFAQLLPQVEQLALTYDEGARDTREVATPGYVLEGETVAETEIEVQPVPISKVQQTTSKPKTQQYYTATDELVGQLLKAFREHLNLQLTDGRHRTQMENLIRTYSAMADESSIREAIQTSADPIAAIVVQSFWREIPIRVSAARLATNGYSSQVDGVSEEIVNLIPRWRLQLSQDILQTETEFRSYVQIFISDSLSDFYNPRDKVVKDIAKRAARAIKKNTGLAARDPKLISGVAKLALYDFVFLCDNSYSMAEEDRWKTMNATLERSVKIATMLNPENGIAIRVLNVNDDSGWNHLKETEDVRRTMRHVNYNNYEGTALGTKLHNKILTPLIQKARTGKLKKPMIVTLITDGEANNESEDYLQRVISNCNRAIAEAGYSGAPVIFLISRVGTSESARAYLENLGSDPEIGSITYVSPADIGLKLAAFENTKDDVGYTELLVQMFLAALERRVSASKQADEDEEDDDDENEEDEEDTEA